MSCQGSVIGEEGLRFFGKMSASFSHELKNALSIINEGAGFLEDLAALSSKGIPFDPQRLPPLGEKIRRQIRRADQIIQRMNRFAHSVETPTGPVDVSLLLRQVCELAERFAAMRRVALEAAPAAEPLSVVSAPFLLQNVAWLCLEFAMQAAREGERLVLQADKTAGGVLIRIQAVSGLSREAMERFLPPARLTPLLQGLGAGLALDDERQRLELALPNESTDR